MEGCRKVNVSNMAFTGMTKLTSLDLSGNKLKDIYNAQRLNFLQSLGVLKSFRLRILGKHDENRTLLYPFIPHLDKLELLNLDGLPDVDFPPQYNALR